MFGICKGDVWLNYIGGPGVPAFEWTEYAPKSSDYVVLIPIILSFVMAVPQMAALRKENLKSYKSIPC